MSEKTEVILSDTLHYKRLRAHEDLRNALTTLVDASRDSFAPVLMLNIIEVVELRVGMLKALYSTPLFSPKSKG